MVKNYDKGKLYIKKRSLPEWLTYYIFLFPFLMSFLLEFLKLPSLLKYTVDISWIAVLLIIFLRKNLVLKKSVTPFVIFMGGLFIYVFITYLFHFQSPFYFLWGVRNTFKVYAAFLAYVTFFNEEDANSCLKFMDFLFWINAAVTFFQFFVLGYEQDYLGGIFGVSKGCNGYSIPFLAIVICKSLLSYMNGQEKTSICFLKCGVALTIAVMAELRFFFILFVILLLLSSILTKSSLKKFLLLFIMAISIIFAAGLLTVIFGEYASLSWERIIELATSTHYANDKDIGRLAAIPIIHETFLTDLWSRLFGMGLGNCDTSTFAICNTPFYQANEHLLYSVLSSAMLFLETGYIGLIFNLSFFVMCFIFAYKRFRSGRYNLLFCQMSMITSILCVIFTFYNSALRTEIGYIAYFVLALPLISQQSPVVQREELNTSI